MKANFLLNGKNVGYLIHGQVFEMQYSISWCLFVIVSNKGKGLLQFRKAKGKYIGLSNAYSPNVSFWAFGFGIKRYTHRLKVNFMNTKVSMPVAHYSKPKGNIGIGIPKFNLNILRPANNPELLSMPQHKELNLILNNEHSLSLYEKVKNEYK